MPTFPGLPCGIERATGVAIGLKAVGTNRSAPWIPIANGWMRRPLGRRCNNATLRVQRADRNDNAPSVC